MEVSKISLIAFDVATSLVDWRRFIEPILHPDQVKHFSQTFQFSGDIPIYEDVRNLQFMKFRCLIGAVGNGNKNLTHSVAKASGVPWDFTYMSEQNGPFTSDAEFWKSLLKAALSQLSISPNQILLITSDTAAVIDIAKSSGINVCYMPRPLVGAAAEVGASDPDLMVSDLSQLEFGLLQSDLLPVRYTVTGTGNHPKAVKEFVNWMRREHGEDLLKIDGCQEFRVFIKAPNVVSAEYIFRDRAALDHYLKNHAHKLRERSLEYFPPEIMQFEREITPMVSSGSSRQAKDFRHD